MLNATIIILMYLILLYNILNYSYMMIQYNVAVALLDDALKVRIYVYMTYIWHV